MRKSALLSAIALAMLLAAPAAVGVTQYTHLFFNATPKSIPQNGVVTFVLSTTDNSNPPTGSNNSNCGLSLPCIPTNPACPTANFINATINEIKVTTPNDPTGPDVYQLGSSTHPSSSTSNPAKILVTKLNQPVNVPYGPGQGGFLLPTKGGTAAYYWWRIDQNGAPTNQKQPLTLGAPASPSPTGLPGTYGVDIEGVMYCTTSNPTLFKGAFFFDTGFQITTPEFGSMLMVVGLSSLALVYLKRRTSGIKIA